MAIELEQAEPDVIEISTAAHVDADCDRVKQLKVLLIEDSDSDARLIMAYLGESETAYGLSCATSLARGRNYLQSNPCDAVLLDLNLPDTSGLATFERLHAEHPTVPVIILTGLDDRDLAAEAVRAGAEDYVAKSHANGETVDRAIRYALERTQRRAAERELLRFQQEMAAARRIQQLLFPRAPLDVVGFDIAGDCRPTEATAGDFFDIFPIAEGRLGLVVADVSSHGFGPALIMTATRSLVRTLARSHADPAEVFTVVNSALVEDTPDDVFVTLFLAILDVRSRMLLYGGAGHEAYVLSPSGTVTELESTSFPLGVTEEAEFSRMKLDELASGDILILLSDGFREAEGAGGMMFGIEQTLAVVHQARQRPAQEIVEILFDTAFGHCQPSVPQDDLTALVVKVEA